MADELVRLPPKPLGDLPIDPSEGPKPFFVSSGGPFPKVENPTFCKTRGPIVLGAHAKFWMSGADEKINVLGFRHGPTLGCRGRAKKLVFWVFGTGQFLDVGGGRTNGCFWFSARANSWMPGAGENGCVGFSTPCMQIVGGHDPLYAIFWGPRPPVCNFLGPHGPHGALLVTYATSSCGFATSSCGCRMIWALNHPEEAV